MKGAASAASPWTRPGRRPARRAARPGLHGLDAPGQQPGPGPHLEEPVAGPQDVGQVIVSNGVINLSPRKARAMAECARVLRPGGRLCVSDLTVEQDELPPDILTEPAAWAGCVAGALAENDFVLKLEKAGFDDVEVVHREPLSVDDCALYPLITEE